MAIGSGITCDVVESIERTECIGNSLQKINSNFSNVDNGLCELTTAVNELIASLQLLGGSSPSLIGIRLSLDPTTAAPTSDIKNASMLYVHPYKGNIVTLWNPSTTKWDVYQISSTLSFPLNCPNANRNYDIYLYRENDQFKVEFVEWAGGAAGSEPGSGLPSRAYRDGTAVKVNEPQKRLVGCLRTTGINQSEQSFGTIDFGGSHPKQFLWNAQNIIPVSVQNFDSGSWSYPDAGWTITTPAGRRPGSTNPLDLLYYASRDANGYGVGLPHPFVESNKWYRTHQQANNNPDGRNNRFSFIIGEPSQVDLHYQAYINGCPGGDCNGIIGYIGIGQNNDTKPTYNGYQIIGELRGDSNTPRSVFKRTVQPGFHYLQTFDMASSTAIVWNEHHSVETGFLATVYN